MNDQAIHPIDATTDDLELWLEYRLDSVSRAKAHVDLHAVRRFYECAIYRKWRDANPTDGLKVKRDEKAPEAPYTDDENFAMLRHARSERDKLIIKLLANTGGRASEIAGIKVEEIVWSRGLILIHGKGAMDRWIAPEPETMRQLRVFVGFRATGPLFISRQNNPITAKQIKQQIAAIQKRAKVEDAHAHRWRTTFAIMALRKAGGDMQAVQTALGHKSIASTARYTAYDKVDRSLELMRSMRVL